MAEELGNGLQNHLHECESRPCLQFMSDEEYLRLALEIAEQSTEPVPCGCVLVQNDTIVAKEYNSQRTDKMAVHHAEVKAICHANHALKSRQLRGATAYCSCEPCAMCLTALSYAKVERVVFAKRMRDLCPDDRQASFDYAKFIQTLNFIPKLEQLLV